MLPRLTAGLLSEGEGAGRGGEEEDRDEEQNKRMGGDGGREGEAG